MPKAGMKPGPWPSIAIPDSNLRPTKIPAPTPHPQAPFAFTMKAMKKTAGNNPSCNTHPFLPSCLPKKTPAPPLREAKIPVPLREARQRTAQRGKTNLDEGECMVSWVEVSGKISQNTAPNGQAEIPPNSVLIPTG